ncbi:MAG: phloretin hydrolase [Clostridiales bacterium]|nr:phloretin hydrolase [Clostridiales bacterium]
MEDLKRVPLRPGAENRSYYKYYLKEFAKLPVDKAEFLKNPVGRTEDGLDIHERNQLFQPGYLPDERGVFSTADGGKLVANNTKFLNATGEMLQWWFAWHGIDPLRYAIWDPFDHYGLDISFEVRAKLLDPSLSLREKCCDIQHVVKESLVMGNPPDTLFLDFKKPEDMGYDETKIGTAACSFFVGANVGIESPLGRVPIVMTHTARDTADGCELRSRFWMGYNIINGKAEYLMPDGMEFPLEMALQLLGHNFNEFTNLSEILPSVYAEEKDHWE